jgi:hypothetical protein
MPLDGHAASYLVHSSACWVCKCSSLQFINPLILFDICHTQASGFACMHYHKLGGKWRLSCCRDHGSEIDPFNFVKAVSWHEVPTLQLEVESTLRKCSKRRKHIVLKALRRIADLNYAKDGRQGASLTPRPRTARARLPARTFDMMNPFSPRYPKFQPLKELKREEHKEKLQDIEATEQVCIHVAYSHIHAHQGSLQ